jgi:hypothetical protein
VPCVRPDYLDPNPPCSKTEETDHFLSNLRWCAHTCASAAQAGHLSVLQWARANGCPWDNDTVVAAETHGHFEVLRWALANGCPMS